jgi:hypothetical protein
MSYSLKGELKVINPTVVVSEKFKKREFVLIDNAGQYAQIIQFQAAQDRCDLLDNFAVGDIVDVHFNLRGREWINPNGEAKVFNTLDAWKIEKMGATTPPPKTNEGGVDDDLPF